MRIGILIAVLIYEIVVIFGVGFYISKKRDKDAEGAFALGGRSMGIPALSATIALTVLGSAHILGVFEMTYGMGAVAIWFSLAHVIMIIVGCLMTGVWVRRLGITTVPEALTNMYGKGVSIAIACVMAGVTWGILTLETQGVGIVIATMTGWTITQAAVVGGILGIFYVVLAGMEEVGAVNVVNVVIMYIGLIVATAFVATQLPGGNFSSVQEFYNSDPAQSFMTSILGTPQLFITLAIGNIIAVTFCQSINQMLMQTMMAARNEGIIKKALWIAAPLNGMFGVFAVVLGLTAKSIPEFAELGPKMAATTMLVTLLPGWLAALLLAALLAAILSTFAMTSLTPATIFAMDIYKGFFNKEASERQVATVIRVVIVVLAAIAIAIAAYLPPIVGAINWLFAWLVPVWWLFLFGLFWKRHTGVAAATIIVTWICNLAWSFTGIPAAIGGTIGSLPNAYVTLIVSLVVLIIGNLVVKGEPGYWKSAASEQ